MIMLDDEQVNAPLWLFEYRFDDRELDSDGLILSATIVGRVSVHRVRAMMVGLGSGMGQPMPLMGPERCLGHLRC
eukprot:10935085-Alexandrium_andersonii.AAC.1